MKNYVRKLKWFWVIFLTAGLLMACFETAKRIYIKSADTSWVKDLGYDRDELYTLKLDRAGCPLIPVYFDGKMYDFNFDTGCSSDIVVTDVLENKIDYTVLKQIEQLNRDGSHRGWSYNININTLVLFNKIYNDLDGTMIDWKMSSSHKFNGLVGAGMFKDRIVTIDYRAHMMGVSEETLDYTGLSKEEYAVVPMLHTQTDGQEKLVFFEGKVNDENILVYIDTGKNVSYIHNPGSTYIIGASTDKPNTVQVNTTLDVGNVTLELQDVYEAYIPQYDDFVYPVAVELNSDQFLQNDIVVTFDFIKNHVIFHKR